MPTIDQVVQINISTSPTGFTTTSFGIPLLITADTPVDTINFVSPDYREYSGLTAVGTDFGTSSATYKAVEKMLSQVRKIPKFYIYARTSNIAQVKTLTLSGTTLTTGAKINGKVNGIAITEVPFNTDEATTLADLDTQITTKTGISGVTVASRVLTVTANSGSNLDLSDFLVTGIASPPTFEVATTTAGYNSVDAVLDMLTKKKDWRALYHVGTSSHLDTHDSLARLCEALGKEYYFNTSSSDVANNVAGNILANLKANSLSHTMCIWHHDQTEHAGAALMGMLITHTPGELDASWETLVGISASTETQLSTTQEANILANNGNVYRAIDNNVNILWHGKMTNGKNWDIIRDTDWCAVYIQTKALNIFRNNKKLNFTGPGINIAFTALKSGTDDLEKTYKILLEGATAIKKPTRNDFDANQRATKNLSGFEIDAQFQGSYDTLVPITIRFTE